MSSESWVPVCQRVWRDNEDEHLHQCQFAADTKDQKHTVHLCECGAPYYDD